MCQKKQQQLLLSILIILFNILSLQSQTYPFNLSGRSFLIDTTQQLTIKDIASPEYDKQFVSTKLEQDTTFTHPFPVSYWIRFTIKKNELPFVRNAFIRQFPSVQEIILYTPYENTFRSDTLGLNRPFTNAEYQTNDFLFTLPLPDIGEEVTYYLQIISNHYPGITLYTLNDYVNLNSSNFFHYGLFFGCLLIIFLYSFMIWLQTNDKAYLFYLLYLISLSSFACASWYLTAVIFAPYSMHIIPHLYNIPYTFMTLSLLLYTKYYLQLKQKNRLWNKLFNIAIFIRIIIFIFGFWVHISLREAFIDSIILLIPFILSLQLVIKGVKDAYFFAGAFFFIFMGMNAHALSRYGFPDKLNNFEILFYFAIIEIILFTWGQAYRFKKLKESTIFSQKELISQLKENFRLKNLVTEELENKVQERTIELTKAKEEILRINELLKADNKKINEDRALQKTMNFEEFKQIYPDEQSCYLLLCDIKWGNGFTCKHCGKNDCSVDMTLYTRRCKSCYHIESATSGTIFSHLRFPLTKAFYLLFLVTSGKQYSAEELSRLVDLRAATCWAFRKKIFTAIEEHKEYKKSREGWKSLICDNS
ncbi:MAG: 7TM diverse intracellular signaling domain-containing protein [Bacteroidales bacterium]|nr:7TM diverse intracellular signaling domain-containing protein [Bacteroidales bacterium]